MKFSAILLALAFGSASAFAPMRQAARSSALSMTTQVSARVGWWGARAGPVARARGGCGGLVACCGSSNGPKVKVDMSAAQSLVDNAESLISMGLIDMRDGEDNFQVSQ